MSLSDIPVLTNMYDLQGSCLPVYNSSCLLWQTDELIQPRSTNCYERQMDGTPLLEYNCSPTISEIARNRQFDCTDEMDYEKCLQDLTKKRKIQ